MIDYAAILARRYQGKLWTLEGDAYEGLNWKNKSAKPTQQELDLLWPEVQQEIADEKTAKIASRQSVLNKLGLTADEAAALLG
jgi:hypothetical protein